MSNKNRRALRAAIGAKPQTLGRKQLAEDACQVCAFIVSRIIGGREQDFRLQDGSLVELGVNKRLEPPQGIRFPKSAAKRHVCKKCNGVGKFPCQNCKGTGRSFLVTAKGDVACSTCKGEGKVACEECQGLGYTWTRDDFAPTCMLCSQFIMAWLGERETLARIRAAKGTLGSKIILPSAQQAQTLGRIIKP